MFPVLSLPLALWLLCNHIKNGNKIIIIIIIIIISSSSSSSLVHVLN
jgi:hypothetical protein